MKKLWVFLLALILCLGLASVASAESGKCGELNWTLDENNGLLTISGTGAIPTYAFRGESEIKSVVIEEGVTAIGNYAFFGCSSLTTV